MTLLEKLMPIVKIEISVPEITKAIDVFKKNRKAGFTALTEEIKSAVGESINQLLNAEIELFLGSPSESDNKRNGYSHRDYALKGVGLVRVSVPKDRLGRFKSDIIPKHERIDPRLKADMSILHMAGLSTRMLSMISKRLLGVEVSKDTITGSLDQIKEEASRWLTRPITERYWALYIDGTNFRVQRRGSTLKEPSLVVLGINEDGYRSVLAVEPGTRDNVDSWRAVFRELKRRGLDESAVRIGVMDGLPGLERLFREEFTNAVTSRCWVHALRNALAKSPARFRDAFKVLAHKVMYASSEEAARIAFSELKETMGSDATRAVKCLEKDLDSLLVHYRFDPCYWQALRTTNAIERINKEFKRRTKTMETLGESTLEAIVGFVALRLEMGWRLQKVSSPSFRDIGGQKRVRKTPNVIEKTVAEMGLLN